MMVHQTQDSEGPVANGAALTATDLTNTGSPAQSIVYSGIRFGADGELYKLNSVGGVSRFGTWMLTGVNTDYSITRGTVTGTLTTDAGAGPLQLNANRDYDVQNQTPSSTATASATFTVKDWNAGSPTVTYDFESYAFSATMESP